MTATSEAAGARERRTAPVELLWDLVFAFAVTQVIALLTSHRLTWTSFWRAMLVLALVWWAWSAFVWVANAFDEEERLLPVAMLVALLFIFLAGLALPRAFTDRGELFAGTYAVVRLTHLALYAEASRRGQASWSSIMGFAVTVVIGIALLVVGSLLGTGPRTVLQLHPPAAGRGDHHLRRRHQTRDHRQRPGRAGAQRRCRALHRGPGRVCVALGRRIGPPPHCGRPHAGGAVSVRRRLGELGRRGGRQCADARAV